MSPLASYLAFALGSIFCTVPYAEEPEKGRPQSCRSKTALALVNLSEEDVLAFARTGIVPARLAGHLVRGEMGTRTRWMNYRYNDAGGYIGKGFAGDLYEEGTLEVFGVRMSGTALEYLVAAVGKGRVAGTTAVMVAASNVVGAANLGTVLDSVNGLKLRFVDSDFDTLSLASRNILGSGISFSREVSFECVRAQAVHMPLATFAKALTMRDVELDALSAVGATFTDGAELTSVQAKALDFASARFNGQTGLRASEVAANLFDLNGAQLSSGDLTGVEVKKQFTLSKAVVDGSLVIEGGSFGSEGKEAGAFDDSSAVNLERMKVATLSLSGVKAPHGMSLNGLRAGNLLVQLADTVRPEVEKGTDNQCSPFQPRFTLVGAQVDGRLAINGTDHLNLDLTDSRANHLVVDGGTADSTGPQDSAATYYQAREKGRVRDGCLMVAGLVATKQEWQDPFPYRMDRLADMEWPGALAKFRSQFELHVGKARADQWYRDARAANPKDPFDRFVRGYLLSYGTTPLPPGVVGAVLVLMLFVAFAAWRSEALDIPAESFWSTRYGRPISSLLFAVGAVTPIKVLDLKPRPGVRWQAVSLELIVATAKILGLVLLGGLLFAWVGYM